MFSFQRNIKRINVMNQGMISRLSGVSIHKSVMQKKHGITSFKTGEEGDAIQVLLLRRIRNVATAKGQSK